MKKILLSLIAGCVFIYTLNASKIPGYYITHLQDTVKVFFDVPMSTTYDDPSNLFSKVPVPSKMQWKIKYYDSEDKKQILTPIMTKEVSFVYKDIKYTFLSRANTVGLSRGILEDNSNVFLHLIKDGKIKLFKGYYSSGGGADYSSGTGVTYSGSSTYMGNILQKENEELFKIKKKSFIEDMEHFFSDCPTLMQKIKDKTYKSHDIEKIIEEYFICM